MTLNLQNFHNSPLSVSELALGWRNKLTPCSTEQNLSGVSRWEMIDQDNYGVKRNFRQRRSFDQTGGDLQRRTNITLPGAGDYLLISVSVFVCL